MASKNGCFEEDIEIFSLENVDLYYVLDVRIARKSWFWRPKHMKSP